MRVPSLTHTLLVGYEHGAVQLWRLPEAPTAELEGGGEPTQEILEMRWNLQPALCLGSLEPHSGRVHSLTTSKDGRLLLSASADHTVTLWSLCDFTPTRTFVFSKAPSHAIPLEPEDFAFVAAVGDSLERVPLTEQMLPLAADRSAMDAAQLLMTREALRNAPKRQDAVEKIQGVSAKARKEEERARKAAKRGALSSRASSYLGSEYGDEEFWESLDLAFELRVGTDFGGGGGEDGEDDDEDDEGGGGGGGRGRTQARQGEGGDGRAASADQDQGGRGQEAEAGGVSASAAPARGEAPDAFRARRPHLSAA